MYGILRQYSGASALIDALQRKNDEAADLLRGAPGFVAYYAIRTDDGLATITVCNDRAGAEASSQIAGKFVRDNLSADAAKTLATPKVSGGEVVLRA